MASNNGYLTHCRICGTPIFSLGNRQFCSACYAQNRRNAAHRSNAEAKIRRKQVTGSLLTQRLCDFIPKMLDDICELDTMNIVR